MAENEKKSPTKFLFGLGAAASWGILGGGALLGASAIGRVSGKDKANQAELAQYKKEFDERIAAYEKSEFQPLDPDALKQENIFHWFNTNCFNSK